MLQARSFILGLYVTFIVHNARISNIQSILYEDTERKRESFLLILLISHTFFLIPVELQKYYHETCNIPAY